MERCLKKLVLDAQAMSFWDSEKGGWEPEGPSGRKTVLGGLDWGKRMYTCNHRRAIKLIPAITTVANNPPSSYLHKQLDGTWTSTAWTRRGLRAKTSAMGEPH